MNNKLITNEDIVNLIFAVYATNKSKNIMPRYTCGKECKCQTCLNSDEWDKGKKDTCYCYRPRIDDEPYFDDITPCKNGGFNECPFYKNK